MPDFNIQKWYLDCTGSEGAAFIGYVAILKWKSITLSYSSIVDFDGEQPHYSTSVTNVLPPVISDNSVVWKSDSLSCVGEWISKGIEIDKQRLYGCDEGYIDWHAVAPLNDVRIDRSGAAANHSGLGYIEKLELTIEPWKLPIDTLIWGRFVSNEISILWIRWIGEYPKQSLYVNGIEVEGASISENGIDWNNGMLRYLKSSVLREGSLINTALKKVPGVSFLFPEKILLMYETKWLSHTEVRVDGVPYKGRSIHEMVRF